MSDPQNAILEMVASGKISADEASSLLAALQPKPASVELTGEIETAPPPPKKPKPKLPSKIRVTILQKDGRTMNATIPLGLLNVGMQLGGPFAPLAPFISAENLAALTTSTDQIIIKIED